LGILAGWVTDTLDSRRVLSDGKYQYQYDDEGNLTRKTEIATGSITNYEWDYRNRLTRVVSGGQIIEYLYDAEDRRVGKKINGVVTQKYVYDGADIALVVDAAGVLVERYLYGAGVDNVLSRESGGAVVWSLADKQGSVVDLVDEHGVVLNHFVYDGFGSRTGVTGVDFRFGYTGRELDGETGLYYYRARYYDPSLGRFISEDPVGFGAGDTNLYRYVNNSPTNFTDPTGTTISGWADDALNAFDSFNAGFWNAATFGISTGLRKQFGGKLATQNLEGGFYDAGNIAGAVASFALGYGAEAQAARLAAGFVTGVRAYDIFGTTIGVVQGIQNVASGTATGWDLLNFAPVAGFAARNWRTIGNHLFPGGNSQRFEMAAEGIGGGGSSHLGNSHHSDLSPSYMAMEGGTGSSGRIPTRRFEVEVEYKYKPGWTEEEIADANRAIESLQKKAEQRELILRTDERGNSLYSTPGGAVSKYESVYGPIDSTLYDIDHIQPVSLGGIDHHSNMTPRLRSVNTSLGNLAEKSKNAALEKLKQVTREEFLQRKGKQTYEELSKIEQKEYNSFKYLTVRELKNVDIYLAKINVA
jgi:RHS repeat-associated protein